MSTEALLLRPAEAAALLGISRSRLYELARAGDLAGVLRIGTTIRVHRGILEAWLIEQAGGRTKRAAGTPTPTAQKERAVAAPPSTA